jgi:exosortase/archaeosortase family protein
MEAARRILSTNRALAFFLLKMAAAYAVWFVVYDLWLLPDGRIDTWLSETVAATTAGTLAPFYEGARADVRTVWIDARSGIYIENGCNGLSALSLFVGFVLAYPGTWRRRALFIPLGLVVIFVTNVVRCAVLLMVSKHWPWMFESVHGLHALFVFYIAIFGLWVAWAHWGGSEPRRPASGRVRAEAAPA